MSTNQAKDGGAYEAYKDWRKAKKTRKTGEGFLGGQVVVVLSLVMVIAMAAAFCFLLVSELYPDTNIWLQIPGLKPFADQPTFLQWFLYG